MDSLETRAELAVLRNYVENQAILEPILLYRASKVDEEFHPLKSGSCGYYVKRSVESKFILFG